MRGINGYVIALALGRYLWHKTAVPVWLERYVLPLLAGATLGIILLNTMRLTGIQRVSLGIAIVALSVFVADLIYRHNHPAREPQPEFATVTLLASMVSADDQNVVFRGLYQKEANAEFMVTPIDCLLWFQITTKEKPTTLNYMSIEVRTTHGWIRLQRIPFSDIKLFAGWPNEAKPVELSDPDIFSFFNHTIDSWKTLNGFAAYGYTDLIDRPLASPNITFRMTLTNSLGQTMQRELEAVNPIDPLGGPSWRVNLIGDKVDLTRFKTQRYSPR